MCKPTRTDATKISTTTTVQRGGDKPPFSRGDSFTDLKKAARKQDNPSRSDQEKR